MPSAAGLLHRCSLPAAHSEQAPQPIHGKTTRRTRYRDIMVLVRRRTHLETYERALRHAVLRPIGRRARDQGVDRHVVE